MGSTSRKSIRTVVADGNHARRETVMLAVLSSQMLDLVAVAVSPEECRRTVEETIPELVMCPEEYVDSSSDGDYLFPLYVVMGSGARRDKRIVSRIYDATDGECIYKALATAASEVVTLKFRDLSNLISNYVQFSNEDRAGEMLDVEAEGTTHQVRIDEIYWIEAARNYVAIHARSGVFDARESISRLAARLRRSGFLRVHRRAVVNSARISKSITQSGVVVELCLTDGTRIPVGRSFRASLGESVV